MGMRAPRVPPDQLPPVSPRLMLRDLGATLGLVWEANRLQTVLIATLSVVQALLPAATLWVAKLLLDAVAAAIAGELGAPAEALGRMLGLLLLQVGISAVASVLASFQGAIRELLGDALQNRISRRILAKANELDLPQFEDPTSYDALQNAYREVGTRPLGVFTQIVALVQALVTLGSVSALMSQLGWAVVPLVLLASVPSVIVSSRFGTEGYRMIRRQAADARRQNYLGMLLTNDQAVKEIRLFDFGDYLMERWQEYYLGFRRQLVSLIRRRSGWGLAASLTSTGLVGAATYLVLRRAAAGALTVGDFGLFIQGIAQLQSQFSNLLSGFTGIYQHLLYMRNLFEFLELSTGDSETGEEWSGPIESIEFRDVTFRYPLTDRDVLRGIDFRVDKGQMLALVGENGAGKSTIVKLITALYRPTSGTILVNGQDASRFSAASLRAEMSTVFQDFGQYQMTVRENIALGRGSEELDAEEAAVGAEAAAIDAAVRQAGRRAGAEEFVSQLPKGYDNMLGRWFEGGRQLSGGQWQRLALARLYFRGGSVLIFDEPTSALDADAEYEVIETLREQARGRIAIIVSHRFSTVRMAERIVVLEGGVITEQGSHEELLEVDGTYARMFHRQARGYLEGY
ncbi:MAG: ABC transporter ATP-binding protein [Deinococcales bacterium]|nr:ABC transporter ATP-binding protein [Deinococcales bacterium]